MKNNNKVLLIDGTSLLVNAFYECETEAIRSAGNDEEREEAYKSLEKSSNGLYIGAVRGLFSIILDAVDKLQPTHVAVLWGTSRSSNIRKEIYANYKSGDSSMPLPLREQFSTAQRLLLPLIKQYTSNKYEAIDLVGTIANRLKDTAAVSILARNSNYLQLADIADVYLHSSATKRLLDDYGYADANYPENFFKYTPELVEIVKGLKPSQIKAFNAIVGNPSSGIPGVAGIGAITAKPLIQRFSTLNNLYHSIETNSDAVLKGIFKEIGVRNPTTKLLRGKENAYLSERLLDINLNVYVDSQDIEDMSNNLTMQTVANELKKVGLLTDFSLTDSCPINSAISFRALLRDLHVDSEHYVDSPLDDRPDGNRGEEEFVGELYVIDNNDDNKECFSLKSSIASLPEESSNYSKADYIEFSWASYDDGLDDDCLENTWVDDDSYDYDDGGENCESVLITSSTQCTNDVEDLSSSNVNTGNISLVESFTINKYKCTCCGHEFMLFGSNIVKFCLNCGVKQESTTDVSIDILEDTGSSLSEIKFAENAMNCFASELHKNDTDNFENLFLV